MIEKVNARNIFNPHELEQKKQLDQPKIAFDKQVNEIVQNAILKAPEKVKTGLIDRVIKNLKNALESIINCFKRCLKIEKDEKIEQPLNPIFPEAKELNEIKNPPQIVLPNVDIKKLSADELYKEAINLMFEREKLTWDQYDESEPIGPFSEAELIERHEHLKKIIALIPVEHINDGIQYREGMGTRTTNLLLHAILNIKNANRRFEIVKLLMEKGINIHQEGAFFDLAEHPIDPIKAAEQIRDLRLLALFLGKDEKQISREALIVVADLLLPCPIDEDREIQGEKEFDNYTKYLNYLNVHKILFKILPEHINLPITLKQGGQVFEVPLLYEALAMVDNIDKLIPIVEALLKRGADPRINGTLNGKPHQEYNVLTRAAKKGNQELNQLLENAIKNRM